MLAKGTAAAAGALVRQLSAGAKSGDYAALVAYLRGLTPSALDQQLRAMQARSMAQEISLTGGAPLGTCVEGRRAELGGCNPVSIGIIMLCCYGWVPDHVCAVCEC